MLTITNLSKTYPNGVRALQSVDLDIPRGMFGLLGPNGAGKSTLMRTIATLQRPDSGSIHFDGVDALSEPEAIRRVLGYLPQDFGVYPRISAQAMMEHMGELKGLTAKQAKETARDLLHQVNLYEVRKKALSGFSGGMKQRFGIAQALIGAPKLLIVDEPTAGLDPEERNRFHNLLSEIGEEIVVILSTHIVDDVTELCPRAGVMAGGRVRAAGSPQDLVTALDGKIWRKTVEKAEAAKWRENPSVISTRLSLGKVIVHRIADGDPGDGFEAATPTLADVYFATIKESQREAAANDAAPEKAAA